MSLKCLIPKPCIRLLKYASVAVSIIGILVILSVDNQSDMMLLNSLNFESAINLQDADFNQNKTLNARANNQHPEMVTNASTTTTQSPKSHIAKDGQIVEDGQLVKDGQIVKHGKKSKLLNILKDAED